MIASVPRPELSIRRMRSIFSSLSFLRSSSFVFLTMSAEYRFEAFLATISSRAILSSLIFFAFIRSIRLASSRACCRFRFFSSKRFFFSWFIFSFFAKRSFCLIASSSCLCQKSSRFFCSSFSLASIAFCILSIASFFLPLTQPSVGHSLWLSFPFFAFLQSSSALAC